MFSQKISEIKYFGDNFAKSKPELRRIKAIGFDDDAVIGAAVRAFLFNRLPKDEEFTVCYDFRRWMEICDMSDEARTSALTNSFHFVNVADTTSEEVKIFDGFQELTKLSDFFKTWMTCRIFSNPEINSAIIYVNDLSVRLMHLSMCLFPRYFPTYFGEEGKSKLTDDERKLCNALSIRTSDDFLAIINKIGQDAGFEKEYTMTLLKGFTQRNLDNLIQNAIAERDRARRRLEDNIEEYRMLFENFTNKKMYVEGLKSQSAEEDDSLADYFAHHKNIRLEKVSGDRLCIYILTRLNWFDMDYYRRASANESIYHVSHNTAFKEMSDRKLLMDSIFSDDPKFYVRMTAYYEISMSNDVNVYRNYNYPADILKSYIPNPHIQIHACLGSYREPIRSRIREGNLMGALDQCIASAQSVNLLEVNQTFDPFMKSLFSSTNKILVDNDGNEYTPIQALNQLKGKV